MLYLVMTKSWYTLIICMLNTSFIGTFIIFFFSPFFTSRLYSWNVYSHIMSCCGNFFVSLSFTTIMIASFVCFPTTLSTSWIFFLNILHVMIKSWNFLLFSICTSIVYTSFSMRKSRFFTRWAITFFFS